MENKTCCPRCKCEELKTIDEKEGRVECADCEYQFLSLDGISKKIKKQERLFVVMFAVALLSLFVGTALIGAYATLYNGLKFRIVMKFMAITHLRPRYILLGGGGLFGLSIVLMHILFVFRGKLVENKGRKYFLLKNGVVKNDNE